MIANRLSRERLNSKRRKKEADQSSVRLFLIRLKRFAAERGVQSLQATFPSLMLLS